MKKTCMFLMILMLFSLGSTTAVFAAGGQAKGGSRGISYADTIDWSGEYDVVVVGFGGAGAVASVTAADQGSSVLLLEKAPQSAAGGNTRLCGQVIANASNYEKALQYYKALRGEFTLNSDADIEFIVKNIMTTDEWLMDMGATNIFRETKPIGMDSSAEYPDVPGSEAIEFTMINGTSSADKANGKGWRFLADLVYKRSDRIEVWYEAPGRHLIQDPVNKNILGVQAEKDGKLINIRAKNGVILACGGFEGNQEMVQNYLARPHMLPKGTPYNTGDGITMALEVGADLWRMGNLSGPFFSHKLFPGSDMVFAMGMGSLYTKSYNVINVGPDAKRFENETYTTKHGHIQYNGVFRQQVAVTPAFGVFDETARLAGPIYSTWAPDNSDALANGMITQGATLEELARKIGLDPAVLRATVNEYNEQCRQGRDPYFSRPADTLKPVVTPPFYAYELFPSVINTQGGPKRNHECEVLDPNGKPIPNLYSAGELGTFLDENYQGGSNFSETIWTGRIAGNNAAKKKAEPGLISFVTVKSTPIYSIETAKERTGQNGAAPVSLKQSEYLGSATGMGGEVTVKLTMNGSRIASVEVVSHGETPGISDKAIANIPGMIVSAQSVQVDTVSGCTVTSNAIKEAVAKALAQVK
jgi:uncharacterized protein with FMN-binding domain